MDDTTLRAKLESEAGHLLSVHGHAAKEARSRHTEAEAENMPNPLTPDDVEHIALASVGGFLLQALRED